MTFLQPGSTGGAAPTDTHTPGFPAPGAVYGNCACAEPSVARNARITSATAAPNATPGSLSVNPCAASDAARASPNAEARAGQEADEGAVGRANRRRFWCSPRAAAD